MTDRPIIEIEWEDHTFQYGTERAVLTNQITVGYLVEETEESITVAQSLTDGKPSEQQYIDKRMFVRKRIIRRGGRT